MYRWTHSGFVLVCLVFFSLEDLMLSLVSQNLHEFVSLLSHLWISATAPWLLHITPSPACLSSHSWWHPGPFWPWCPDSSDHTAGCAYSLQSVLKTKCCLFIVQFLSVKLIKQPSFHKASDPLAFLPFSMLKIPNAARFPPG